MRSSPAVNSFCSLAKTTQRTWEHGQSQSSTLYHPRAAHLGIFACNGARLANLEP